MEKTYPIDIYGVKNTGIEEWMKNYYSPVSWQEHQDIYEKITALYMQTQKKNNDEVTSWLAFSNLEITFAISRHIFDLLRLYRLGKLGYENILSNKKEKITDAFLSNTLMFNSALQNKTFFKCQSKNNLKNSLRILKYNLPGLTKKNFFKNFINPNFLIGSRYHKQVSLYCNEKGIYPIQFFPQLLTKKTSEKYSIKLKHSYVDEFISNFLSIVSSNFPIIRNSYFEMFASNIKSYFINRLSVFNNHLVFLEKFKPRNLLVEGIGNQTHRLFCSAWRYSGGNVIGFTHGNAYCTSYRPSSVIDGYLTILNKYVASSSGEEEILKKAIETFSLGKKISTEITHNRQNIYYPIFKDLQKKESVHEIKKVMIVGFPMTDRFYAWLPGRFTFSQLYLELFIVKLLKTQGYYVIYKAHPDKINEVDGIFEKYADKVLKTERFEDIYDIADCLLFSHAYTTTFGFSLLTKKPIVLIKIKGETWFPRAFELLKRRCCIVDADPDDSGRILFNDQDLIDAVATSLNNIDYEILHQFAF